jgi:hypothetical protein
MAGRIHRVARDLLPMLRRNVKKPPIKAAKSGPFGFRADADFEHGQHVADGHETADPEAIGRRHVEHNRAIPCLVSTGPPPATARRLRDHRAADPTAMNCGLVGSFSPRQVGPLMMQVVISATAIFSSEAATLRRDDHRSGRRGAVFGSGRCRSGARASGPDGKLRFVQKCLKRMAIAWSNGRSTGLPDSPTPEGP